MDRRVITRWLFPPVFLVQLLRRLGRIEQCDVRDEAQGSSDP
jgi:hypothetical protein